MREWGGRWIAEMPQFPRRTTGIRVWFIAVMAVSAAAAAAFLTPRHRWKVTTATLLGGLIGLALAAVAMWAIARIVGVPLAPRVSKMSEFRDYIRSVAVWRFVLEFQLPLSAAGQLLTDQAMDGRPFWIFTTQSWSSFSSELSGLVVLGVVGRWFMRHALKGRDDWGMEMTKGRITPAPRVK